MHQLTGELASFRKGARPPEALCVLQAETIAEATSRLPYMGKGEQPTNENGYPRLPVQARNLATEAKTLKRRLEVAQASDHSEAGKVVATASQVLYEIAERAEGTAFSYGFYIPHHPGGGYWTLWVHPGAYLAYMRDEVREAEALTDEYSPADTEAEARELIQAWEAMEDRVREAL